MSHQPIIAREGWFFVALTLIVALVATVTTTNYLLTLVLWLLFIFVVQFFRDPVRNPVGIETDILSPADGKIVAVQETTDPYLKRDAIKISVFMSIFNVHSNRSPANGLIKEQWYESGSFFNAALDKASEQNERNALWMQTPEGNDIVFVQIAGLIARRILCYVESGDTLTRGQRYGFIRFGSRVDVYLPKTVTVHVTLGDTVHAATSILASFNPTNEQSTQ